MIKHFFYIVFGCAFLLSISTQAQSRKELENQRKEIKKEMEKINSLLFSAKKKKTNALDDLKDINQKISTRKRLIKTIELEASALNKEIKNNTKELQNNQKQLKKLKDEYSEMVVKSYKSKSKQSKTMFLLSSKNFYQAYKRLKYMEQYKKFQKKQGEEILTKISLIKKLNDSLDQRKKSKGIFLCT